MVDSAPMPPLKTPHGISFALIALALGGFGIGIGEFAIMGLLPEVATSFAITPPEAGHAISAYALGVVIGAPVLTIFLARVPQKAMLIGLMIAFTLGNFASAFAPNPTMLVLFRFLSGLPHGAYFGIASLVAAAVVPVDRQAQSIGKMMLGISLSNVFGVPLITWLGQGLSWRTAFSMVGVIGMATVIMLLTLVPHVPVKEGASPKQELAALAIKQVWLTLLVGAIGFGGMFAVYSYIAPTLTQAAGAPAWSVPVVMSIFGIGMIGGSMIGGWLADRALHATLWGLQVFNVLVIGAFYWAGTSFASAAINVLFIGFGVAIVPAMQMRLMEVAKKAQSLAASLNHAALNVGNAMGAWLGGLAIAGGFGWTSTGWVGALLGIAGMAVFAVSMTLEARTRACL